MPARIFVNQVGYMSALPKIASVCGKAKQFSLIDTRTDEVVFTNDLTKPIHDKGSGDRVSLADFSEFSDIGRYRIKVGNALSPSFEISDIPYAELLDDVKKTMYFARCGTALHTIRAGKFRRKICHAEPVPLFDDTSVLLDVTGGWHGAGDYSRSVVPTCLSLAYMLYSYSLFPNIFKDAKGVTDTGRACPQIIEECLYGLEWLLKMQDKDGGVYHRVSSRLFADGVLPSEDKKQLFVFRKTASATINFAAVTALATRILEPLGLRIIKNLRPAATAAWAWVLNNMDDKPFKNPKSVSAPEYSDPDLRDDRFWAMAELYQLTGEEKFLDDIDILCDEIDTSKFTVYSHAGFGTLACLFAPKKIHEETAAALRDIVIFNAEKVCSVTKHSGYNVSLARDDYVLPSNLTVLSNATTLIVANMAKKNEYFSGNVQHQLNYLLGNNPLGQSYITGYGEKCIRFPHYRPTLSLINEETLPGLLVCGPDKGRNDEYSRWLLPYGTPPAKCHIDKAHSYATNEPSIYLSSAMMFVLGYLSNLAIPEKESPLERALRERKLERRKIPE